MEGSLLSGKAKRPPKARKKEVLSGFDIETPEPNSPKDVTLKSHCIVTCSVASCDHQYILANRYSALMLFRTEGGSMKIICLIDQCPKYGSDSLKYFPLEAPC